MNIHRNLLNSVDAKFKEIFVGRKNCGSSDKSCDFVIMQIEKS